MSKHSIELAHRVLHTQVETKQNQKTGQQTQVDKLNGSLRFVQGALDYKLEAGIEQDINALEKATIGFILSRPDYFPQIKNIDIKLDRSALLINKSEQFLKFRLYKNGFMIEDAVIDLRFKFGNLVQIANRSFAEVNYSAPISVNQKSTRSLLSNAGFKNLNSQEPKYRISAGKKGYQSHLTTVFKAEYQGEDVLVYFDNAQHNFFEVRPLRHYIQGRAKGEIFRRYYNDTLIDAPFSEMQINLAGQSPVVSSADGLFEAPLNSTPQINGLMGPMVRVITKSGALVGARAELVGDEYSFDLNKIEGAAVHEDKNLAQHMVFYHTNQLVNYAKNYISSQWFNSQLVANANLTMSCNAHWDGSTINFYSANSECANTGLISDVVFHEWGHGLDANTGGIEDSAYSEGFGDIMSLIMTRSNILGIGFLLNGQPVRDLEPDKIYPQDQGEVHYEGMIIGSTFWDLFKLLRDRHDENTAIDLLSHYAFKSILTASRYTEVYAALLAIDDEDGDLSNGSPNYCLINEAFKAHGLASEDSRCMLGNISPLEIRELEGNGNGVVEPREEVSLNLSVENNTGTDLDMLEADLVLSNAPFGVSLLNDKMHWPMIPNGQQLQSNDPAGLRVAADVACGSKFNIDFHLRNSDRQVHTAREITIGQLVGETEQHVATGLPLAIVDQQSVNAPIENLGAQWSDDTKIHHARLTFEISHTYVGDLTVHIVSPQGEAIQVYRGVGSGDDVSFDQDITEAVSNQLGRGVWNLRITDSANQDVGTLDSFSLELQPALFECE